MSERSTSELRPAPTRVEDSELSKHPDASHRTYTLSLVSKTASCPNTQMHHTGPTLSHSYGRQRVVQTPRCITQDLHSLTRMEDSELSKQPDASHRTYTLSLVWKTASCPNSQMHHTGPTLSHSYGRQRVVQTPRCITQDLHSLTRMEDSELSKHPYASSIVYSFSLVSKTAS